MGDASAYLSKGEASARMGTAAEYLVAAVCILATSGELNVSTSLVDDEGVDLIFHRRGSTATLAVQVKARMSTGKHFQDGRILTDVSVKTFRPRRGLDVLVVAVDVERGAIDTAWLVPSLVFGEMIVAPNARGKLRFSASMKDASRDRWTRFRLTAAQLSQRILQRLHELEDAGPGQA